MSKRKPAAASKHAHRPKISAKAQRAVHDVVKSPKDRRRSVEAHSTQPSPKPDQGVPVVDNAATALQEMTGNDLKKGTGFSLVTANVQAYQAKLLEIAQANTQFAFEFAQRLAAIRSPVDLPGIIAEFTSKRMAMFRKHSTELVGLSAKRRTG